LNGNHCGLSDSKNTQASGSSPGRGTVDGPERFFAAAGGLVSYARILSIRPGRPRLTSRASSRARNRPIYPCSRRRSTNLSSTSKTAKTLGIDLPPSLLARADEVIEQTLQLTHIVCAELCGLATVLHHFGDDCYMPKIVQVHAAIALQCPSVPTDVDLMDRDAGDRSGSGRLVAILADPNDAVAQCKSTSHCGIHAATPRIATWQLETWRLKICAEVWRTPTILWNVATRAQAYSK
jgi:hypothetical protein